MLTPVSSEPTSADTTFTEWSQTGSLVNLLDNCCDVSDLGSLCDVAIAKLRASIPQAARPNAGKIACALPLRVLCLKWLGAYLRFQHDQVFLRIGQTCSWGRKKAWLSFAFIEMEWVGSLEKALTRSTLYKRAEL